MALNYGLKISKPGQDVLTAADKDLIFSSKLNIMKVSSVGVVNGDVAHGLSYVPAFFAARDIGTGGLIEYGVQKYGIIGQSFYTVPPYTDATYFHGGGGGNTRYYIFFIQGS